MRWEFHEAKADFTKVRTAALEKGPQVVRRGGVEVAVLVPFEEWKRLQNAARPGLKKLLLGSEARMGELSIQRRTIRRREPVEFE